MKALLCAIVFWGSLFSGSVPAAARGQGDERVADTVAIRQVSASLDAAWNRRDAAALGGLFLDDADFQWHTGEVLSGRKQIEQYFAAVVFSQLPADFRHLTMIRRLRFLGPDAAIGDGTIVVAREKAAEGEAPHLSVLFTCVGQKIDGIWKIAAVRLMLVPRG